MNTRACWTPVLSCVSLAGVLIGASSAAAQPAAPIRPPVGPERPFRPASRVERTLANGLTVIVVRHATVPRVSATLTVRTGLASDPDSLTGLAALAADAIQEGTRSRDSRRIRREAFAMGGSLSAAVSQDFTSVVVRGLAEFTPGLLDLLADVVVNPTFPENEVAILKARTRQTLQQQKSSPQFLSNRVFRMALFGAHPYARVSATPESVQAIDRGKIAEFHANHYRPNHAFLMVVGDVQPDAVVAAAGKAFGAWEKREVPAQAFSAPPALAGRKVVFVQRPDSVQSSLSVGNFAVKRSDPRWFELLVANTIYGGAFNSRIVRNIREQKGYSYSPQSQFQAFADAGLYRFAADIRNEVTGPTLTEVFNEVEKMRTGGAEDQELGSTKQYLRGVYVIGGATQAGLATQLNAMYVFGLPRDYLETYQSRISAVTPAQVKEAAATLLGSENAVIVIVGDYEKVKDQLGAFPAITFVDLDGKPVARPGSPRKP